MEQVLTSLSFGAGVNSTALLILYHLGKVDFDYVIFADTMNERPETYLHVERYVKPFCEEHHIPFYTVSKGNLYDYYFGRKIIPFRLFRHCTDKFKIKPIKKLMKKLDSTETMLGIDFGEKQRAFRFRGLVKFPLIDMRLDREKCKGIIQDYGWEVPVKSGCWFCPFQTKQGWLDLLRDHRELFLKAERFEKNCIRYPEITLSHHPLARMRKAVDNQRSLCEWVDPIRGGCVYCHT